MQKPLAICLMGPTASGKTDLAMALADILPVEIISVDSALIYKGMDIGTAKPSRKELAQYPHHLIDIKDPAQNYSAAEFREDALALMHDITARGKIPLLVGGTMLYFKVLQQGISLLPEADSSIRKVIDRDAEIHGWEYVHKQLSEVDPEAAARIHPNDPQRIQRALEVYRISGKSLTALHKAQEAEQPAFNFQQFAVMPSERKVLHERIALRFDKMLEQGFLNEVRALFARDDLHLNLPAIRSVGYRQAWLYLQGEYTQEQMREKAIVATRQLAKRQITWLRSWQGLTWLDTGAIIKPSANEKTKMFLALAHKINQQIKKHQL